MSEDYAHTNPTPITKYWTATNLIIAANLLVFLIQFLCGGLDSESDESPSRFNELFALSLDGLQAGHLWQLVTYQFMHASLLHILLNMWGLFVFGQILESVTGKSRMLQMYFLSGIAGGLLQVLWMLLLPPESQGSVVGASAGLSGLLAAFAMLFPKERITLLLFFFIPIKMKARTLLFLWIAVALVGLGSVFLKINFMSEVAHAAHLGGALVGCLYAWLLVRHYGPPQSLEPPNPSLKITPVSN